MSAPHVYRITKYDPVDVRCAYRGSEDVLSDHGPVEAAYLAAVAAFAEDSGVTRLTIRDPAVSGVVHFGAEPPIDGHGLHGLFSPDLTGSFIGGDTARSGPATPTTAFLGSWLWAEFRAGRSALRCSLMSCGR